MEVSSRNVRNVEESVRLSPEQIEKRRRHLVAFPFFLTQDYAVQLSLSFDGAKVLPYLRGSMQRFKMQLQFNPLSDQGES